MHALILNSFCVACRETWGRRGTIATKYLSAVGEEKGALANAVVSQRRLLTNAIKRRLEMEAKLQPLQLEAKYLVLEDRP